MFDEINRGPEQEEMRSRLIRLENSQNNGKSSVPARYVPNVFATPRKEANY